MLPMLSKLAILFLTECAQGYGRNIGRQIQMQRKASGQVLKAVRDQSGGFARSTPYALLRKYSTQQP